MEQSDVVLLLMASKSLGFNNREVQGLLNETLSVKTSSEQIDSIYRAHEHKYIDYRKNLKSGKKTIPRRIIRYAKKYSIRIDLSNEQSLLYQDVAIISYAISSVMSRSRIKISEVSSLVHSEFPEKSFKEINQIIDKLFVEGYRVELKEFVKNEIDNDLTEFSSFIERYGLVNVCKGNRTFFDRRNNNLLVKDGKIMEFLVLLLDRQNQYYSEEVQSSINKVDSLL